MTIHYYKILFKNEIVPLNRNISVSGEIAFFFFLMIIDSYL